MVNLKKIICFTIIFVCTILYSTENQNLTSKGSYWKDNLLVHTNVILNGPEIGLLRISVSNLDKAEIIYSEGLHLFEQYQLEIWNEKTQKAVPLTEYGLKEKEYRSFSANLAKLGKGETRIHEYDLQKYYALEFDKEYTLNLGGSLNRNHKNISFKIENLKFRLNPPDYSK